MPSASRRPDTMTFAPRAQTRLRGQCRLSRRSQQLLCQRKRSSDVSLELAAVATRRAVTAGCGADEAAEAPVEGREVLKACANCNRGNRIRALAQPRRSAMQPCA